MEWPIRVSKSRAGTKIDVLTCSEQHTEDTFTPAVLHFGNPLKPSFDYHFVHPTFTLNQFTDASSQVPFVNVTGALSDVSSYLGVKDHEEFGNPL